MRWEEMTSAGFADAARGSGVCVLAMGVVEKHGDHLPLGTDYLLGHWVACRAAEKEPAIVFPPMYLGQIFEARAFPGTLTIPPRLMLELYEEIFEEIARNGITKILLINFHGGNNAFIKFLAQCGLARPRRYALYAVMNPVAAMEHDREGWAPAIEENWGGHAGESETSMCLAALAEMVHMDRVPAQPGRPLERLAHLPGLTTSVDWYSDYPEHYAGDARKASAEKGRKLLSIMVDFYADCIRGVKEDRMVPGLLEQFYGRERHG